MSSISLEIINLKRQIEVHNAILQDILDELKRFNDVHEKLAQNNLNLNEVE